MIEGTQSKGLKDEQIVGALVPVSDGLTIQEWRQRLCNGSDEAIGDVYQRAESLEERFKVLACLSVAILHDRYQAATWPATRPPWWPNDKQYPPKEPYWSHLVGHLIGRSYSTAYRRYRAWLDFERIVTNDNSPETEELALELGSAARGLIQDSTDPDAALIEAIDLKAEVGDARGDMLAARLQEAGLLPKAKWEYGCPCGCGWWGRQREFRKRPNREDE